jgi:hypothetical protein
MLNNNVLHNLCACRTILPSSGHQRFLHSALILNGLMMVFGGNTHNDTQYSQGAKCQSSDLLAYDLGQLLLFNSVSA